MGDAKRRKDLGLSQNKDTKSCNWIILEYKDENYSDAQKLKDEFYPNRSNVFLVQINYIDSQTYVGAVHIFLDNQKLLGNAVWALLKKDGESNGTPKNEKVLLKVVLESLAKIVKKNIESVRVVIFEQ
jgi:hypothetical protein